MDRQQLEVVVVATLSTTLWAESRVAAVELLSVVRPMLHLCTKLCANVFIYYGGGYISIFTTLNMAVVRRVGFVGGSRGTTQESLFTGAIPCKNFVMMGIVVLKL